MKFNKLSRFIADIGRKYNIPCYDICIYYDHVNVYRNRRKLKSMGRNYYFLQSGTKIMVCAALMRLIQDYEASLNDSIWTYLPDFPQDITLAMMIAEYSRFNHAEDSVYSFSNIKRLIEVIADMPLEQYIEVIITNPLKMKETSFDLTGKNKKKLALQYRYDENTEKFVGYDVDVEALVKKNDGCVITTVDDYARFCETMCAGGTAQNGYQLLTEENTDILLNELIYKETEKQDVYISIGRHGGLVLIDRKKKISIVYAQNVRNMPLEQLEMYPKLRELVYECTGVDTWSMGYNVLP